MAKGLDVEGRNGILLLYKLVPEITYRNYSSGTWAKPSEADTRGKVGLDAFTMPFISPSDCFFSIFFEGLWIR